MKAPTAAKIVRAAVSDGLPAGANTFIYLPWAKSYVKVRGEDLVRVLNKLPDTYLIPFEEVREEDSKVLKLWVG